MAYLEQGQAGAPVLSGILEFLTHVVKGTYKTWKHFPPLAEKFLGPVASAQRVGRGRVLSPREFRLF